MLRKKLIKRIGVSLFIAIVASPFAGAQSPALELLNRTTRSAELQELSIANQAAQDSSNAAIRRANLLSRQVRELRAQRDQLESEMEVLRSELDNASKVLAEARRIASSIEAPTNLSPANTSNSAGLSKCLQKCWVSLSKAINLSYPNFPDRAQMPEPQLPPFPE